MSAEDVKKYDRELARTLKRQLVDDAPANIRDGLRRIADRLHSTDFQFSIVNGVAYGRSAESNDLRDAAFHLGMGFLNNTGLEERKKTALIESVFTDFVRESGMDLESGAEARAAPAPAMDMDREPG